MAKEKQQKELTVKELEEKIAKNQEIIESLTLKLERIMGNDEKTGSYQKLAKFNKIFAPIVSFAPFVGAIVPKFDYFLKAISVISGGSIFSAMRVCFASAPPFLVGGITAALTLKLVEGALLVSADKKENKIKVLSQENEILQEFLNDKFKEKESYALKDINKKEEITKEAETVKAEENSVSREA